MSELVSVIVPIYKVESYLERCINSILMQTYKNLEIILIDDGSPDKCGQICDIYAERDSRIVVIHKDNGGLSDARNVGIKRSKGEYLTFIDSDDWVHETFIEKIINICKAESADLVIAEYLKTADDKFQIIQNDPRCFVFSSEQAMSKMFGEHDITFTIACGKLYRKSLFANISFPLGRKHEDQFTTYKLYFEANRIVYTTDILYFYWQRNDSIMSSKYDLSQRLDLFEAFWERAIFFDKAGYTQLRDRTYKRLFYLDKSIQGHCDFAKQISLYKEFRSKEQKLHRHLRSSRQRISFRIAFELYYLAPGLTNRLINGFKNIRMKLKPASQK